MTFKIYDNRLNRVPSQESAASWDEMVAWAQENGLTIDKRRTEWSPDKASALGVKDDVISYAACFHQGGIRALLVEVK